MHITKQKMRRLYELQSTNKTPDKCTAYDSLNKSRHTFCKIMHFHQVKWGAFIPFSTEKPKDGRERQTRLWSKFCCGDTDAVTQSTDSFAAYGVQRGCVSAPDKVQWQTTPEHRSEGVPITCCCCAVRGSLHLLLFPCIISGSAMFVL